MERESFIFYRSFYDSIKGLGDAEFAECMRFLCEYGLNGAEQTGGTLAEVVLKMAKPQIDANNQRRANGAKGGRPKASPSAQEQAVSDRKTDGSETENHRLRDAKPNLKYQLKICGCPSKEVKSKIAELLELVHLKDTRKLVMNYSLGMRQRLALAMALVGNPQFLILDEPLNGLDPEGIKDVRAIIAKLNEEYGVTIMISSHILSELQKVANHYGFLKNGVLIQEFSSSEIADTDLETFYFKNFL